MEYLCSVGCQNCLGSLGSLGGENREPRNEFWSVISYEHIETFYKERNDQRSLKIISTCF